MVSTIGLASFALLSYARVIVFIKMCRLVLSNPSTAPTKFFYPKLKLGASFDRGVWLWRSHCHPILDPLRLHRSSCCSPSIRLLRRQAKHVIDPPCSPNDDGAVHRAGLMPGHDEAAHSQRRLPPRAEVGVVLGLAYGDDMLVPRPRPADFVRRRMHAAEPHRCQPDAVHELSGRLHGRMHRLLHPRGTSLAGSLRCNLLPRV